MPYFVALGLSQELTGLRLKYWSFPGTHYIGWVTIINYKFPMEELLFWIIIFSTCVLCYFEFMDDNHVLIHQSTETKIFSKRKR